MAAVQICDLKTYFEEISDYSQLQRGDHLAVRGKQFGVKYYHHGIYLGSGKVVDFGGTDKSGADVRITSIDEFTKKKERKLVRVLYDEGQCLPLETTAKKAEELAKKPGSFGTYGILENNCEHFATYCKTGKAVSMQVIKKMQDGVNKLFTKLEAMFEGN